MVLTQTFEPASRMFSYGVPPLGTENSIFKLYIRNFINISSFHNLLDVIYTEVSGTMKQFTVWIGMQYLTKLIIARLTPA